MKYLLNHCKMYEIFIHDNSTTLIYRNFELRLIFESDKIIFDISLYWSLLADKIISKIKTKSHKDKNYTFVRYVMFPVLFTVLPLNRHCYIQQILHTSLGYCHQIQS